MKMNIFIGGSKNIGRLSPAVKKMLCSIIRSNHHILIGDCYGIDLAVQHFLNEQKYENITIYTACNCARRNVGGWKEVIIAADNVGFSAHREKDVAMANACDFGIMIWNGSSKGTFANIKDLKTLGKKVVIINETS